MCVQTCWNVFETVRMASHCTITGAHIWPNALALNPWTDPTRRQLCSQIPIKSGLQHMCESRFQKEWWEQWDLFSSWKWRIISHRKSRYIIMYILLLIVMSVLIISLCSCLWPVILCLYISVFFFFVCSVLRYKCIGFWRLGFWRLL